MSGTFSSLCSCSKLISWFSFFKLGPTKSVNYYDSPLSCRHPGRLSSSLSIASNKYKYEHMFPSFYDGYVSHRIEWLYSVEPPHPPCTDQINQALQNVLDKDRMDFPNLGTERQAHYEYDFDDKAIKISAWEGDHCDVISLLSTHGDQLIRIGNNNTLKAECLRGKYILICCASIPSLWVDRDALLWRKLSLLASEMYNTGTDFEIVMVANMRGPEWDDEGVFNHFFTAFTGCLVVPFHHKYRREYICRSLGFNRNPTSIVVDPSQKVIHLDSLQHIVKYGARGFPFTSDHLSSLSTQDHWAMPHAEEPPCNTTLAGLLSCESDPTSFLLRKLNTDETISVKQLNKHHVGLYLLNQGDQLKQIHNIYQQCKDEGLDFEIVLVPLSYVYSTHPKHFQDIVCNVLNKLQVPNWWIIPFNNSVYMRLYNLSWGPHFYCPGPDRTIVVGPHNSFVDRRGGEVIYHYDKRLGTQAYPFTREALYQAFLQRLGNITLESFLQCDHVYQNYECDDCKMIPVTELRCKNVVVYMDIPQCLGPPWIRYDQVVQWYSKIKQVDSDFEVVFVPSLLPVPEPEFEKLYSTARECIFESKMKWHVCPFNEPKHLNRMQKNDAIKLMGDSSLPFSVIAFGKDGHIHSVDALRLFSCHGDAAYPFLPESRNEILRDEIRRVLLVITNDYIN